MIKIKNLCKSFNDKIILDNLNLEINKGEILVIIGQSGCGKSVLLKHIIGLLKPNSGNVFINNSDVVRLSEKEIYKLRKQMGMVFQHAALFDSMTVYENVAFALKENKVPDEKINEIVFDKLKLVNLGKTENQMPDEISGGMKKRVGIARAVAMNPEILLYDEPTTGLDPITSDVINNLILDANQKLNTTSIVVTHDMQSAYKIADRIAMMYKGKIIECDTPDNIKNTVNPFVQQFINGHSEGPITT